MGKTTPPAARLAELQALAGRVPEQVVLALSLVQGEKDVRTLRAALDVLARHPSSAARPLLLQRYAYYAADGIRRDAGTYLRSAILLALRRLAEPGDLPLLEQAACTYEYLPPTRSEEAGQLRSAALVVMNEVDGELAGYHAVRLLADPENSPLSGEPALTAIRVLAAQGNRLPLYYYALYRDRYQGPRAPASEVLSECLKSLAGLPAALLPGLLEKYRASPDEVVLVGLIDLAFEYEAGHAFLGEVLTQAQPAAIYRYLVTRIVESHHPQLVPALARAANQETDPARLAILDEALAVARPEAALQAAHARVRALRAGRAPDRRNQAGSRRPPRARQQPAADDE